MGKQSTSVRSNSPAPASPASTDPWPSQADEDIDRLVAMHQNRSSLSSLGVSICIVYLIIQRFQFLLHFENHYKSQKFIFSSW